ncbi:unnamed protein product [Cyprideis torosa]|uniref:Uncharacterized protein n=1 Tax=Cyprideis torosa TaxID=163714 RepID=A0A7R8WAV8_9CRUS|nr:unnamed protein product [Cyprideis torosa]CAG0891532.1 unnamed protein product [Cyprideis torosa]
MSVLNAVQLLLEKKQPGFSNSDLYKQLNIKATILGSYIRGVNSGIDAIKRSKRLIDVVTVKEEHEKTKESGTTLKKRTIKHFNELERNEKEKSKFLNNKDLKLRSSGNSLIFNYLTKGEDSGARDQALMTVANAYDEALLPQKSRLSSAKAKVFSGDGLECLPADYKDVAIGLRDVDLARIQEDIFYSDKEYKDLTRELAIAKLKEQRTYWHAACRYLNSCKANMRITSIDDQKINNVYDDQEINELIEIVTDVSPSDTALRFNLEFKGANVNSINKELQGSMQATSLKVSFDNLDKEGAKAKVESIKASTFDIEFVTNKARLLKLLKDNLHLKSGMLSTSPRNQVFKEVDRRTLLQQVHELKSDEVPCFIKFTNLSQSHTADIINSCHETAMFNICFNSVHNCYSNELKEGPVNFCFEELGKEEAEMVIKVLREKNFEFFLQFNRLSDKQVRFILQCATLDQEHMKVTKVKNVSELFMAQSLPKLELNEFISKGMEYIIEINEELFIPWRSVCIVAVLAAGQVVAGGALMVTGFGGSLGLSLVTEGIADAFVAYRAYSTRQFRWSDYALQKTVSLVLSATSLGLSKWKEAAKGVETVTTGVGKEALEQAATQIVTNKKVVVETLKATGQNLKSLTCKVIGTKVAEAAARETLNAGVQALSNLCFESLKPDICLSVQSSVRRSFDNPGLKGLLYKMHAIDVVTKSSQLQAKVQQIVAETINPQQDSMKKMWNSVGLPLLKGTLADSGRYASTVSMGIRIIGTLNGLKEVLTLTDAVVETLIKKLRSVDRSCMTICLVLHTRLKINKEKAKFIAKSLKDMKIFDEYDNLEQPHDEVGAKIDNLQGQKNFHSLCEEWAVEKKDVEKVIAFLQGFHTEFGNIEMDTFSEMMKSVSDQIAEQLIRIMDSQLLQPWSTLAVSGLTDALSKRIQHQLVDEGQNSESQKADQEKYDELSKKENLTDEEKAFMSSYGKYRTFLEQYNYNSRDYCIAYSQSEMAYYAAKHDEDGQKEAPADKTVSETADSVRKGSPADLATMIATAKMNGVNLKVVDNKDYVLTEEDKANGVQVVYVEQGKDNEIGHAYYMDQTSKQFVEAESTDKETGKLKLDPGDVEALEKDLDPNNKTRSDRGGKYRKNFKDNITKEDETVELKIGDKTVTVKLDQALHHIISNEKVEGCTLDSIRRDKQGTSELLEKLINRPGTKEVIERRLAGQPDGQMTGDEVGKLLHGAVSWNPSNVVRGPDSDYRVEDPHKKTPPDHYDREIKRHQPQQYQDAVTEFETTLTNPTTSTTPAFEQFVNLPRPEPVQWGETQTPRKGLSANTKKKLEVTGLKERPAEQRRRDETPDGKTELEQGREGAQYDVERLRLRRIQVLPLNGLLSKDDVMKRLTERPNWNRDEKVLSTTLRGSGSGEYKFYLCYIPTDFVESREKLDSLLADEWEFAESADNVLEPSEIGKGEERLAWEGVNRTTGGANERVM